MSDDQFVTEVNKFKKFHMFDRSQYAFIQIKFMPHLKFFLIILEMLYAKDFERSFRK